MERRPRIMWNETAYCFAVRLDLGKHAVCLWWCRKWHREIHFGPLGKIGDDGEGSRSHEMMVRQG